MFAFIFSWLQREDFSKHKSSHELTTLGKYSKDPFSCALFVLTGRDSENDQIRTQPYKKGRCVREVKAVAKDARHRRGVSMSFQLDQTKVFTQQTHIYSSIFTG